MVHPLLAIHDKYIYNIERYPVGKLVRNSETILKPVLVENTNIRTQRLNRIYRLSRNRLKRNRIHRLNPKTKSVGAADFEKDF